LSRRYQRLRERTGVNTGVAEKVTRGPVVAGVLLAAAIAAYLWWKRRRAPKKKGDGEKAKDVIDPKLEAATALYRALEMALSAQGISRPTSLPPLKHAEELVAKQHPLGDDVL